MSVSSAGTLRPDRSTTADTLDGEPSGPVSLAGRLDEALLKLDLLRDRPVVSATLAGVAIAVLLVGWWLSRAAPDQPVEAGIPFVSLPTGAEQAATGPGPAGVGVVTEESEPLVVHVAGAVVHPGIVVLEAGARIVDAIDKAGGARLDADLHRLNLAAPVADGMQVRVPMPGETVAVNGTAGSGEGAGAGPLDLNAASAAELESLHGIGPALASAIVTWRTDNGPFTALDDLLSVPGIGPAKLAGLSDLVTL